LLPPDQQQALDGQSQVQYAGSKLPYPKREQAPRTPKFSPMGRRHKQKAADRGQLTSPWCGDSMKEMAPRKRPAKSRRFEKFITTGLG
jgi:hypothetical protein